MSKIDLNEVIHIHVKAFPGFFLTLLGRNFLYNLYYSFIKDANSICMVAEKHSIIKGFIVGNQKPDNLFRKMLHKKGYIFLFFSFKALIRHPVLVSRKLFYALRYRGERPSSCENAALISSIAVDPGEGSKGVGSYLIRKFCTEAFSKGADAVYLTTDKFGNESVNSFYIKNGFKLESVIEKSGDRKMNRYIKLADEKII